MKWEDAGREHRPVNVENGEREEAPYDPEDVAAGRDDEDEVEAHGSWAGAPSPTPPGS